MAKEESLYRTYRQFMKVKGECSCTLIEELNLSELTIRQIDYIKKIGKQEKATISSLAEMLEISKPSITEMIKKFISLDCVYKEQCREDGRVQYIYLTQRGRAIADFEDMEIRRLVGRISNSLNEQEMDIFISLLMKII